MIIDSEQRIRITLVNQVQVQAWDSLAAEMDGGYFHSHVQAVADAMRTRTDPLFVKAVNDVEGCVGVTTGRISTPQWWPFSRHCRRATLLCLPATQENCAETERLILQALEVELRKIGVFELNVASYDSPNAESVLSALGYTLASRWEFYIDLTHSVDDIWDHFKSWRRRAIRKADKLDVETRLENTEAALEVVWELFGQAMAKHGIEVGTSREETRKARLERLANGQMDVFVAYRDGTPVSGGIFANFNGKPSYLVSGSSHAGYDCCGPIHLIWTAIQHYKEHGAIRLNLGAAMEDQESLYKFKRDFGAKIVSQPTGKKILSAMGARMNQAGQFLRHKRP